MDIVAHGLWVGAGAAWLHRHRPLSGRTVTLAVGLTVLPDLVQLLPLLYWVLFRATDMAVVLAYINGLPGAEPVFEPALALLTHHLHCVMHSALVAGVVTGLSWAALGRFWWPLAGWWAHIVVDVFSHSADFYPSPVLYPLTQRGFDGVAWNTPVFMAINYLALAGVYGVLGWRYWQGFYKK